MSWSAVIVGGSALISGYMSSESQEDAASAAAGSQDAAAMAGIAEQRRQFDQIRELLRPYVDAGTGALSAQQDLIGLGGPDKQQAAINALRRSPQFTSLLQQGEESILANASATGGLRGGNTQAALAQFSPALLAQTINDQYSRLGGLTSIGQNAAAGVGNAGMSTGNAISQLLQQQGAAQAGAALAGGRASAGMWGALSGGLGAFGGMGGFDRLLGGGSSYPYNGGNVTGSETFGWKGAGGF
jgi:hypothetical protein